VSIYGVERIKTIDPVENSDKYPKGKGSGIPCEEHDECLTNEKCAGKEGNKKCILSMEKTEKRVYHSDLAYAREVAEERSFKNWWARQMSAFYPYNSNFRASSKSKRKKRKKTKKKLKKTKKRRKKTNKRNR